MRCLCEKPNAKVKRCLSAEVYRFFKFRGCSPLAETAVRAQHPVGVISKSLTEHLVVIYVIYALELFSFFLNQREDRRRLELIKYHWEKMEKCAEASRSTCERLTRFPLSL